MPEFNGDVVDSGVCRPVILGVFGGGGLPDVIDGDVVLQCLPATGAEVVQRYCCFALECRLLIFPSIETLFGVRGCIRSYGR